MSALADGSATSYHPASIPARLRHQMRSGRPAPAAGKSTSSHLHRQQILDVTAECLHDAGYDGTTIRRIAARLECAVGSIYRYFKDKRQLLDAVTQQRFEPVETAVEAGMSPHIAGRMYSRIATEEPEQYRLMFWLASVGGFNGSNAVPGVVRRILDGWSGQLDDRQSAERYWSQLHGRIMLNGSGPEPALTPAPESLPVEAGVLAAGIRDEEDPTLL